MKKLISLFLCLVMVLSLFTGCSNNNGATTDGNADTGESDVIKIGVFEPLTGENGGGGLQELGGIEYANKIYPEVLGKKIELVVVDNKTDKGEATTAVSRLIEKENVVAIIGSYGSGVSIAAGDIIKNKQIPTMGASCTNPMVTQGNDYYFRACFLDPFQGKVMANYALDQGAKTAAVIMQNGDDYSIGLGNFFINAFKELTNDENSIVDVSEFQVNDTDFNAILTNVKAKNPDVIFAPSSATTAPLIIKQARALGIESLIMGGDTWENPAVIDVAGNDAEGIVLSTFFDENDPATEEAKKFVEGYKAELGDTEPIIPAVSALGYDAYILVRDAIERAGSTDGTAIRDAIAATENFEGVTGVINFTEEGDADKSIAVIKTVQDGQFVYIDTVEVK
ncbi:ABC transporter substrate-binding protein [Sedimentibacter sp. MB31-C6]|uniref:ABC transporter substrate-binding protein n=1 Tax=Sedimentibacter sp. MB31-C6 TaxID=3109366 RepID=UPI002DDCD094|nr:ABC transporter substrate-binding protein [Sedimentibacter sp. MB36-C1]WSI05530.1 ABC transporter substrate-binding protein [Sedimentibacter sp. MB36-C1]